MQNPKSIGTKVPEACNDSDGNRILPDIDGYNINLARCLIAPEPECLGHANFCDEMRSKGICPKGLL